MKKLILQTLSVVFVAGLLSAGAAQDDQPVNQAVADTNNAAPPEPADMTAAPDVIVVPADDTGTATDTNATEKATPAAKPAVAEDQPAAAAPVAATTPDDFMPPTAMGTNSDELRLNFNKAPLEMVLNYLSDAAGFIIVLDTEVKGTVSVISKQPMTRSEAVDLLNAVLNKNGLAAIRDGRTLTIVDKNDAKTRDIPVKVSNDPAQIPNNAEIVTQIIPIRFVEAEQLVKDLASFVSSQATIVANEAGNSIVITDTQSNIRHLVQIIKAIDSSAEGETEIRVFHMNHANPSDVASELAQIFPSSSGSAGATQSPIRFGGGPGGGGGGPGGFFARMMGGAPGGGGNAASSGSNSRVQKQSQVVAVADLRTSSVVVSCSKDLMQEIAGMMAQLDVSSTRDQKVFVYHVNNSDPQQTMQVLQSMFGGNSSTTSRGGTGSSTTGSALQNRQTQNATGTGSTTTGSGMGGGTGYGGGGAGRGGF